MQIELIGKCEEEKDLEGIKNIIKEIATSLQMKTIEYEELMILEVCPLGKIRFTSEDNLWSLDTNSDFAGAGYHDHVIKFYEKIEDRVHDLMDVEIIDPSGYHIHHDFNRLMKEYLLWMEKLCISIEQMKDLKWFAFGLSEQNYLPDQISGYVNTHMYRKPIDYFKKNVEDLAEEFFIWHHQGKNAKYYRNCAYYLLYNQHYDEYLMMNEDSIQCGNDIISYLESAYALDHNIPLPLDSYDELCMLLKRKKGLEQGISDDLAIKGYRSECVYYEINDFYVFNDGHCELSYDYTSDSYYFMAPYKSDEEVWQYMYIYTTSISKSVLDSFKMHDLKVIEHDQLKIEYYDELDDVYHAYSVISKENKSLYIHAILKEEMMMNNFINLIKKTLLFESGNTK